MKTPEEIQEQIECCICAWEIMKQQKQELLAKQCEGAIRILKWVLDDETKEEIQELQQDLEHFEETSKTRELNSFEKGIKEEVERLLDGL